MVSARTIAPVVLALLTGRAAVGQARDPVAADKLFREARALMNRSDFASACPKLVKSHELDPAPGTLINLGDCREGEGKLADALQALRDALKLLAAGDDRVPLVRRQVEVLDRRVPRLTIKLAPGTSSATSVSLDGAELPQTSMDSPIPVNPGTHVIRVNGKEDHTIDLEPGAAREIVVVAGADADQPSVQSGPVETDLRAGSEQRTIGFLVAGVGAVGLVVGTVAFVRFKNKESERESICPSQKNCTQQEIDRDAELEAEANAAGRFSAFALVGGAAALAGGVALVLTAPTEKRRALVVRGAVSRAWFGVEVGGAW